MDKCIVIMVGNYYPNYSAVGRCMGNIAEEIVRRGYRVIVVSQKTEVQEANVEVFCKQEIIRIATKHSAAFLNAKAEKRPMGKLKQFLLRGKRFAGALLHKNSIYSDTVNQYLAALENLKTVPDVIIPTCLPFETVCAAVKYKKRHPCTKVFPVLYDLFATNGRLQRLNFNMILKEKANKKLEREMFAQSEKVFGLKTWNDYVKCYFPEFFYKFTEIEHPLLSSSITWGKMHYEERPSFVYAGSVDLSIRNPTYVLELFHRYTKKNNCILHMYTMGSAQSIVEDYAKRNSNIICHGAVSNDVARTALNGSDYLISIGNINTIQTPSKIFEYFCTGLPIIHFAFNEDDPVIQTLLKYPHSCVVMINDDIDEAMNRIENFTKFLDGNRVSFDLISEVFREASPRYVVDTILK